MTTGNRREAITDQNIRVGGISPRSLLVDMQWGTFPARYAGTVNFGRVFRAGSAAKVVMLQRFIGSSSVGRDIPFRVPNIGTAHFTYRGSGRRGTFMWLAIGSAPAVTY